MSTNLNDVSLTLATATTPPTGDATTKVATTAFVQNAIPAWTSGANGNGTWERNPNGTLTQRASQSGPIAAAPTTTIINFPIAFANTSYSFASTSVIPANTAGEVILISKSTTSVSVTVNNNSSDTYLDWIAVGS